MPSKIRRPASQRSSAYAKAPVGRLAAAGAWRKPIDHAASSRFTFNFFCVFRVCHSS
jgi:hypothetical protein